MVDYIAIYNKMEAGKDYTAKDLGVAPASMTAMVRRDLVVVTKETSPKTYRKNTDNNSAWIIGTVQNFLPKDRDWFIIHIENEQYGMMCSLKNNIVIDCYGNPYDLSRAIAVEIGTTTYYKDGIKED